MKHIICNTAMIFCCSIHFCLAQRNIKVYADINENDSLKKLVTIFTDELKKSSTVSFTFQNTSAYQGSGIYISKYANNQLVKPFAKLLASGPEAFSIMANEKTIQIVANTYAGVSHGIFSYLDFIGYRYYFANPDWYIVPSNPILFKKWSVVSSPSFFHRRIWYGYGTGSKAADADYNFWVMANRLGGSINAYFGHSYGNIIAYNKDTFLLHPEWFYPVAQKGTIPGPEPKFDMSREDLIQFLIRYTMREIEASMKNKTERYKMISMAPSDGPGTCNSPACQQLGTITDRVYYLVNRVAKAIQKKYPSTLIGCMAYGEYSPPPTKKVEPNVFVGITTAFNNSTFTLDKLIDQWRKTGAMLGIYDYFSWYAWDFDIPGQSLASRSKDIINSIKKYYANGIRAYEGESSIGWISKGLGYYLAARQMWDVSADPIKAKQEFFRLCFGKAIDPMQKLWSEWENYSFTIVRETDLAHWIDYVNEAEKKETDKQVSKRLLQIKSYLHYLYLYRNYQASKTEANLLALLSYGYRKLDEGSVSGYPAVFVLGGQSGMAGMGFEEKAKWKADNRPVSSAELNQLLSTDRSQLKVFDPIQQFAPVKDFKNVPDLSKFQKLIADSVTNDAAYWMTNEWVIGIKNKSAGNYIDFTGDFIGDPTNKKAYKISIYPCTPDGNVKDKTPVLYYEYNKKQVKERISLAGLNTGNYTMLIEDPVKIFRLSFSRVVNFSMVMRPDRPVNATGLYYGFIYVPEGVKKFNIVKQIVLHLVTPTGRKINFTDNKEEDVQVDVLKGEQGLWQIKPLNGKLYVEGIPPYLSTSAAQMLIPSAVK